MVVCYVEVLGRPAWIAWVTIPVFGRQGALLPCDRRAIVDGFKNYLVLGWLPGSGGNTW